MPDRTVLAERGASSRGGRPEGGRGPAAPRQRPPVRLAGPGRRLSALLLVLGLVTLVLGGRLVQLQGFEHARYSVLAQDQRLRTVDLLAPRGEIEDRNGVPLAVTVDARDLYADPTQVQDAAGSAARLSPLLHIRAATLLARLTMRGRFVYLARGVAPSVAAAVSGLGLAGVHDLPSTRRVYPDGALAGSLIGFVGIDGTGLDGLEYLDDRLLSGHPGRRVFEVGQDGAPIPDGVHVLQDPVAGTGLRLTIDSDVQWAAQQAIDAQVRRTGARSGSVIVMDPRTGQLLALANAPDFDPNHPGSAPPGSTGDPAVSDPYEPGSVNKVITMAAGLQTGTVTPDTPVTVPPVLPFAGRLFHDAEVHGTEHLTVTGVLAQSSNIGTIEIAARLGRSVLYHFLRAFGFGSPTGIGLPGESGGILPALPGWSGTTLPTVAFGQGVSVTALQVASVYATVANGGVYVRPTIVLGRIPPGGGLQPAPAPPHHRVISARTAAELRDMLEAVTSDQGTAPAARIIGYRVAGKTGTAQRPDGQGGYSGYTASFVGFAPADAPQLLVEVVLQDPVRGHFGGAVAAPVFHDVMAFALQSLHIAPTGTRPPVARLTAP